MPGTPHLSTTRTGLTWQSSEKPLYTDEHNFMTFQRLSYIYVLYIYIYVCIIYMDIYLDFQNIVTKVSSRSHYRFHRKKVTKWYAMMLTCMQASGTMCCTLPGVSALKRKKKRTDGSGGRSISTRGGGHTLPLKAE